MTPLRTMPALLVLVSALAVLSGCARKKPVLVVPKEPPPTTAPTPTPTPQAASQPAEQAPAAQATDQPPAQEPAKSAEAAQKPKAKNHHHAAAKKPSAAEKPAAEVAQSSSPRKGDAAAPAAEARSTPAPISPAISPGEAARDQSTTDQLLQNTEANLNGIKRQLSADEESVKAQILSFVAQSRQALKDNDPTRARNLAVKAHLLSSELAKAH